MPEDITTLFVYGLFRQGAANWSMIHKSVRQIIGDIEVPGRMYYDISGLFPVTDFDETDYVVNGDIIKITSDIAQRIDTIEQGAGYVPRELMIELPNKQTFYATAYHWPHSTRGVAIYDGDWFKSADYLID